VTGYSIHNGKEKMLISPLDLYSHFFCFADIPMKKTLRRITVTSSIFTDQLGKRVVRGGALLPFLLETSGQLYKDDVSVFSPQHDVALNSVLFFSFFLSLRTGVKI
jgi:hypothetical protein